MTLNVSGEKLERNECEFGRELQEHKKQRNLSREISLNEKMLLYLTYRYTGISIIEIAISCNAHVTPVISDGYGSAQDLYQFDRLNRIGGVSEHGYSSFPTKRPNQKIR
jgi:hypothetical protein